ncbi:MAG: hypothetical protein IAE77_11520 [Prosthecobacter sp.]|jgi:hypothetical protein|uniref:DUF6580 family putative transport protein n=1 Tax=Prosthecobacter sp. TaxID=1965333 RepID=UPI001A0B8443|nr:DUF6580 family putative transport protein [Prosthecobacter sp.]MBE2284076.1 hypothetical protein [Prosthecobacter sp.]
MNSRSSRAFVVPFVLVLAAVLFRYFKLAGIAHVPWLENFTPWMALAFTGTLVFPKRVSFLAIPALLLVIGLAATGLKDVLHWEAVAVYGCFGLAAWFAARSRGQIGLVGSLLGVTGCSVGFYLITNTVSWLHDPVYAKTLAGWAQALTSGTPGLPPTTWFLRQSLLSDLLFSCLLLAAYNTEAAIRRQPAIPVLRTAAA